MAPMPYAQVVSIMCRDHAALADFYTAAFGFQRVPEVESPIFVALSAGGVALGFHADEAFDLLEVGERRGGVTGNHVTFDLGTAEAVDASVEAFTALGATVVKGPFTTYYDARQVVYLDPEGNVFRVSDTQEALASLAGGRGMSATPIPVVDLTPFRTGGAAGKDAVAAEIDAAYREVGFASIIGHGVDPDLVARLQDVTARFFALPAEVKARSISPTRHPNRGYQPMGNESLSRSYGADAAPPDLFEAFTVGPVGRPDDEYHRAPAAGRYFEPNDWPAAPPDFEEVWTEYYVALEAVADLVMDVFGRALGLDEGFFVPATDRHITALRSLHYPPTDLEPLPGQMRIGQHTDFGSITVLLADDTPGLQVAASDDPDPVWIDVPHVPGAFVVNVGDLLSEWSNRRWRSTRHRVAPVALDRHRTSWAFFHHPNYDAVIECLPECATGEAPVLAEPVTAGDYLWRKLEALTL